MTIYKSIRGYITNKNRDDRFEPNIKKSTNWKHWVSKLTESTCLRCLELHGKIYSTAEIPIPTPPLHIFCKCKIQPLGSVVAGEATNDGLNGADWWLMNYGTLPSYYLSEAEYRALGWKPSNSPSAYAPGMMLTRGIYRNWNKHLPDAPGRIWYEADLNYYTGKRNKHRMIWSNDGLLFVTYDHYTSFIEVIGG